nr:helix-turn-helix domain-containing protein [Candidatus Bathyarchaeota archaeon]
MFVVCMVGREGTLRSGEVAELLGVGKHTVARWTKEGRIR